MWQQGNRDAAIEEIRQFADACDPSSLSLIAWFLHQMPEPRWKEGIPYAETAASQGNSQPITYFLGPHTQ